MSIQLYEKVMKSVKYIQEQTDVKATIGLILGSGLGGLVDIMENKIYINYEDIPYFPESTVKGHASRLVFGTIGDKPVVAMQGRFHFYEGYDMKEVVYPVYVMKKLGVETIVVTNSCGGINTDMSPGSLMIINDFINLMGANPLFGPNDERFGPRFPDMTEPYKHTLIDLAKSVAKDRSINYYEGVYAGFMGPCYETAAEIRAYGNMGADAIGMSTVPETITANYLGMNVLGIACITNMATGIQQKRHSHADVVEMAEKASINFCDWLEHIIIKMP